MSAPASVPPPRRPGLARCRPEVLELRLLTAAWLRAWCRETGTSRRDLVAAWSCSRRVVDERLDGTRPIHLEDLAALPPARRTAAVLDYLEYLKRAA